MHDPHGPHKITVNGQVTLPAELLRQTPLDPGGSVYVAMAEEIEGALIVVPAETVRNMLNAGQGVDAPSTSTD